LREELKHIDNAPAEIKKIIEQVISLEKEKLHDPRPRGIREDVINIIKKEIQ
jgi:hypothetical protein